MPDRDDLIAAMTAKGSALRGLGYRVWFDLTDTDESILLDGTGASAEVRAAEGAEEADSILALSSDNLGKLIAGKLSPMLAFTTGKLRVEGSKGVAMKLAGLLDED